jgi:YVTN family beta-propeller protein
LGGGLQPDGGHASYVTNSDGAYVSVIDVATSKITGVIYVGNGPAGVAVSPDGAHVYVADFDDDSLSIVDV